MSILSSSPIFSSLDNNKLNALANGLINCSFEPNQKILYQGDNGKGKEYNHNGRRILFPYLPKKEKIKKYIYDGQLIFEGEYSKGIRWNGKGLEYDHLFRIIFQGDYINGKHFGTEYIYIEKNNDNIFQTNNKKIIQN